MKRFGGRERVQVEEFELQTVGTGGEGNVHVFRLRPELQAGDVVALMDAIENSAERSMGIMAAVLRKVLVDDDGTPAAWEPPERPAKAKPGDVVFTGPDNETHTLADTDAIDRFLDPVNGSSRKRWDHLMSPANEEGIHLMDMVDISQWVVSLSTDRPTQARTPSIKASRKTRR